MSSRVRCIACNSEWPASIDKCYKCGQPLRGGVAAVSEESAAAQLLRSFDEPDYGANGAFRDGNRLVMIEGGQMPRRCAICNSESIDYPTDLTISRETKEMGGVSGLVKAGADRLAGWNYTGPVEVSVYFCERHQARWRNRMILGAVISLVSIAYLVYLYLRFGGWAPDAAPSWDAVLGVVGMVAGIVMVLIYAKSPALVWFKPRKFVDRTVWVTGASREFLESLPTLDQIRR